MRGGRNKLGTMYKKDRARRMQQQRTSSSSSASSLVQHLSDASVTSSTPQYYTNINGHARHQSYDANIQSPTLSSSTHSPPSHRVGSVSGKCVCLCVCNKSIITSQVQQHSPPLHQQQRQRVTISPHYYHRALMIIINNCSAHHS
jgi:hypothetical protein